MRTGQGQRLFRDRQLRFLTTTLTEQSSADGEGGRGPTPQRDSSLLRAAISRTLALLLTFALGSSARTISVQRRGLKDGFVCFPVFA